MPPLHFWRPCPLTLGLLLAPAMTARSQEAVQSVPAVSVRRLRLDPLLLASSLDSARLRQAVTDVLRAARRLGQDTTAGLALDLDIAVVPRPGEPLPQAFVRIEVGRNRMERGLASRLVWDRSITTGEYRTFRALAAALSARVVGLIEEYLTGRTDKASPRRPPHDPTR